MARIVMCKGNFRYGGGDVFLDRITKAFAELGHDTYLIDLSKPVEEVGLHVNELLAQHNYFYFSFNCMNAVFPVKGRRVNVHEMLGLPWMTSLIDHPLYHLENLGKKDMLVTCVDYSHAQFLRDHFKGRRNVAFLPHGGSRASEGDPASDDRPIDVLFSGSCILPDPEAYRNNWGQFPAKVRQFMQDVADLALTRETMPVEQLANEVLESYDIWLEDEIHRKLIRLLFQVDMYIRGRRRINALKELDASGVAVDIFGQDWESGLFRNHRIHGPMEREAMLKTMTQAKVVLNLGPNFPNGSHERVFSAQLNGAVSLTDRNPYFEREFQDGRDLLMYDWTNLSHVREVLDELLANPERRRDIAASGRAIAEQKHTWLVRVQRIMDLMELYKGAALMRVATAGG